MVCRHSRPASTPSAPSSGPPFGTVSMCEPVSTAGAPEAPERVARLVDPGAEAALLHPLEKPGARLLVSRTPARARDAATVRIASEARERLDVRAQAGE